MHNNVEILAPAGSVMSLQASFKAGADAVYMGGTRFGARAYAENPNDDELIRAIDYAHLHGKRLYLTVNTLVKESEFGGLYDYLNLLMREGLDAVLIQDLGVLDFVMKNFKSLPIHISTQGNITESLAVRFYNEQITRIVPARELTLEEIRELKKKTGREIEVFVHGALCYSYSGQCLFSSMCGDRSGNRGRCAQHAESLMM
jgi:putative protease